MRAISCLLFVPVLAMTTSCCKVCNREAAYTIAQRQAVDYMKSRNIPSTKTRFIGDISSGSSRAWAFNFICGDNEELDIVVYVSKNGSVEVNTMPNKKEKP